MPYTVLQFERYVNIVVDRLEDNDDGNNDDNEMGNCEGPDMSAISRNFDLSLTFPLAQCHWKPR